MNRFGRRIVQMAAGLPKMNCLQEPSNAVGIHVDLDAQRIRLQNISETELITFWKKMHDELVYPLTHNGDGKPSVSAFSIQLDEARAEWQRRKPNNGKADQ